MLPPTSTQSHIVRLGENKAALGNHCHTCFESVKFSRASSGSGQTILEILDRVQEVRPQSQNSAGLWVDEQQRVRQLFVQRQNVFEFSRQGCQTNSGNRGLAPGVEDVVQGHPGALAVGGLHDVHAHRIGRHHVDGILKQKRWLREW